MRNNDDITSTTTKPTATKPTATKPTATKRKRVEELNDNDIVDINVRGKVITTLRSTLTNVASGTKFSSMFNGQSEDNLIRDDQSRVFLDHDPNLMECIVNFLSTKKIENKSHPVRSPPIIPDDKKIEFEMILQYYELFNFFYQRPNGNVTLPEHVAILAGMPSSLTSTRSISVDSTVDIKNIEVVKSYDGKFLDVIKSENEIQFSYEKGEYDSPFLSCKPSLDGSGDGFFWKVIVNKLYSSKGNIFIGIIGNISAPQKKLLDARDATSYGWIGGHTRVIGGSLGYRDSGWTKFTTGECLHFHFKSDKLTMYSVQKNRKFTMDVAPPTSCNDNGGAYYIHFNAINDDTQITLKPLTDKDARARLLSKFDR